jgi:hypothetical protein
MPRKRVMLIIYLLVAGAIPLLLVRTSTWSMYAFAVIFGLGLGGEYLIIPLMAGELFGIGVLGRVMGIVLTGRRRSRGHRADARSASSRPPRQLRRRLSGPGRRGTGRRRRDRPSPTTQSS